MSAIPAYGPSGDVFFTTRKLLRLLEDPNANAERLGRLIETVYPLSCAVCDSAEILLDGHGRSHSQVSSTSHAVALIGFNRLERIVRRFIRSEFARLVDASPRVGPRNDEVQVNYAAV